MECAADNRSAQPVPMRARFWTSSNNPAVSLRELEDRIGQADKNWFPLVSRVHGARADRREVATMKQFLRNRYRDGTTGPSLKVGALPKMAALKR